ncbi:MAG TPA: hypothetical protein DEP84_15280, partial [Chloroflexi bacterium]|nr:hypothetical protein [Chloroflexota bacterium]
WLAAGAARVFLVTGGPGSGKTALAARLVQMGRGEAAAADSPRLGPGRLTFIHFCQALDDRTRDPLRFIEALSQTLAQRYIVFGQALLQTSGREITITQQVDRVERGGVVAGIENVYIGTLSAQAAFDRAVRKPLEALCTPDFHETILILVDALDEALTYNPDENIVTLLGQTTDSPADLPSQVRLILTSRPDPRVLSLIGQPALDLIDDAPEDVDDVRAYTQRRLQALPAPKQAEIAGRVALAGKGNFLYARYVLDELLAHPGRLDDLDRLTLPEGLDDIYRQFLRRELARNPDRWSQQYRPVLGVLAVARGEGLTRTQMAGVTGHPPSEAGDILRASAQYLAGSLPEGPFRLYHQSFRDFLLTDAEYQVYPGEANQAIAEFFLDEYADDWLSCDDEYALQHTPAHLAEGAQQAAQRRTRQELVDALGALMTDFRFLEAKSGRVGVDALLTDLATAVVALPPESQPQSRVRALQRVLEREARHLRGWNGRPDRVFLAQQVHNRAVEMGHFDLSEAAAARLAQLREPYLALLGRLGTEAPDAATDRNPVTALRAMIVLPFGRWAVAISDDDSLLGRLGTTLSEVESLQGTYNLSGHFITNDEEGNKIRSLQANVQAPGRQWAIVISDDTAEREGTPIQVNVQVEKIEKEGRFIGVDIVQAYAVTGEDDFIRDWAGLVVETRVALTPDGRRAISVAWDHRLRVWDLQPEGQERLLGGHAGPVSAIVVTPDGRRAVSASVDRTLRVWNLQAEREEYTFSGHGRGVAAVAVTPDSRRAISGAADGTLKVWDLETGQEERTLSGHTDAVYAVAVTPDGSRAVSASWDHTLRVWNLATGREEQILAGHNDRVLAVALTPGGERAVSASADGTLKVWTLETGQEELTLAGHNDRVYTLAVTPDGRRALSAATDTSVKVWNLRTGREERTLDGSGRVFTLAVTPDGRRVISTAWWDNTLNVWDLETGARIALVTLDGGLGHIALGPDGVTILAGDDAGTVYGLRYVAPDS